jgi:hypothetical protein
LKLLIRISAPGSQGAIGRIRKERLVERDAVGWKLFHHSQRDEERQVGTYEFGISPDPSEIVSEFRDDLL